MPRMASSRGLLNPFKPVEALCESASYLHELSQSFGNVGLAGRRLRRARTHPSDVRQNVAISLISRPLLDKLIRGKRLIIVLKFVTDLFCVCRPEGCSLSSLQLLTAVKQHIAAHA
jgi:hypothetical protein